MLLFLQRKWTALIGPQLDYHPWAQICPCCKMLHEQCKVANSPFTFHIKKNQLPFKQGGARRRNPITCETFEFQMIHMQFRKHSFSIWCDKLESQENKFLFHQLISRGTYSAYLFKLTRKKRMYGYQGVKVVRFKESLACFVFFLPSLFCIITDVLIFAHISALKM